MERKLEIMKFRSRESALRYANGAELKAKVRMKKYKGHKWANRVGNVAVLFLGRDPGGERYLFEDGGHRYHYQEGT